MRAPCYRGAVLAYGIVLLVNIGQLDGLFVAVDDAGHHYSVLHLNEGVGSGVHVC